ncbi:MAG: choice-of-anchor L domain-containing protein [Polyangiaceae bacterium]|nr:choice-of-anchor L domain-containing protein [Polyangiaceae bacterium]
MKRTLPLIGLIALGLAMGCDAKNGNNVFTGGAAGSQSTAGNGGNGGNGGSNGVGASDGGIFDVGGGPGAGGANPNECISGPDEDKDQDGASVNQGDCNDCDPNVGPGAIEVQVTEPDMNGMIPEPADENCDGMVDNVVEACDMGIALNDTNPMNGAKAVDLCETATPGDKKWGVLQAAYVRADGSTSIPPNALQYGILDKFGPNVNVQRGQRMLGLSSGYARTPDQPGNCGSLSCYSNAPGTAPAGFPQDVPACPGSTAINDDVALELKIRSPKNATGYKFNFKFYSFEYPEWVCTSFNDQYISLISPPPMGSINGNVSFDTQNNPVSVNVAFFDANPNELVGTGFDVWDDAGATSWLQTQAPIKGGDEITVRFAIWDTGDSAWDSTALVDNFQWIANGGTVVVGTIPIPDPK